MNWLIAWLVDWLIIDWLLIDYWLIDWLIEGVIDWLINLPLDVELECDGYLNYDRTPKWDAKTRKQIALANQALINAATQQTFD